MMELVGMHPVRHEQSTLLLQVQVVHRSKYCLDRLTYHTYIHATHVVLNTKCMYHIWETDVEPRISNLVN